MTQKALLIPKAWYRHISINPVNSLKTKSLNSAHTNAETWLPEFCVRWATERQFQDVALTGAWMSSRRLMD